MLAQFLLMLVFHHSGIICTYKKLGNTAAYMLMAIKLCKQQVYPLPYRNKGKKLICINFSAGNFKNRSGLVVRTGTFVRLYLCRTAFSVHCVSGKNVCYPPGVSTEKERGN